MNVARCESSIATSRRQTRASDPRATTTSLRATCRWLVDRPAAAQDHALRAPSARRSDSRRSAICSRTASRSPASALDRKPDLAQVDPEDRHVHLGDGPGRPQERAVAAQDDQRVRGRQLAQQDRHVVGLGLPVLDPAHLAPAGGARAQLDRRLVRGVVGEPDPADGHAGPPSAGVVTAAIRLAISARSGPGRQLDEELAVAVRAEERRGDDCPGPEADRPGLVDDALQDLPVDRRIADDAVVRAARAPLRTAA